MQTSRSTVRAVRASFGSDDRSRLPHGEIVHADALELLRAIPDASADIIFLDPPFNLGKSYGKNGRRDDRLGEAQYYTYMSRVLTRAVGVLKPGGALYLYHLPRWSIRFADFLADLMTFRHWIAISMKNGFARGERLYPAHYSLLYFTKGEPRVFRRPKIPALRCRKCRAFVRDYGGYKQFVMDGINLSDVWDDLSPVRHAKYKNRSANELPLEIPRRVVRISGRRGGLFVDPFAGTGTALLAAQEAGMLFVGADKEKRYCRTAYKRLLYSETPTKRQSHAHD
jgi:site-specific DNA-methyltransferase (adenine-specific)